MQQLKQEPFDHPGTLMIKTAAMLKERNLFEVYSETKIPFYWLRKFASGETRNPSVNRVQYLYEHLNNSSLI